MEKRIKTIVYGGKLDKEIILGGLLWLSKVGEELAKYEDMEVIRIPGPKVGKNRLKNLWSAYINALKVLRMKPDAILLDAGKDGNAAIALLSKIISRKTRIYIPIHHYEPIRIGKHNVIGRLLAKILLAVTYKLNRELWERASKIYVVSKAAGEEISEKLRIPKEKLILTGNSIEMINTNHFKIRKDIDFFCIGRIGKFSNLQNIWREIKRLKSNVKFHMAGMVKDRTITNELTEIGGFKHHGVVNEKKKNELFLRSKVFIFPSIYEGFGIAVGEALSYGLPVVVWDLPVYREIWGESEAVIRVKINDTQEFARKAVFALENFNRLSKKAKETSKKLKKSWRDIGKIVHDTIIEAFNAKRL
ncbi:MAG: hypothetical protein DRJ30_06225 [Candidatus Methanomethylicota archaeon]|nr:MAG: hypothetical protein DRJ30_06225 [Candidatus Verstraetearchaeota archaeon]